MKFSLTSAIYIAMGIQTERIPNENCFTKMIRRSFCANEATLIMNLLCIFHAHLSFRRLSIVLLRMFDHWTFANKQIFHFPLSFMKIPFIFIIVWKVVMQIANCKSLSRCFGNFLDSESKKKTTVFQMNWIEWMKHLSSRSLNEYIVGSGNGKVFN